MRIAGRKLISIAIVVVIVINRTGDSGVRAVSESRDDS